MVDTIKYDCFACKEKDGKKVCDALDKLYCKKEKSCKFYITQEELSAKRIELANRKTKGGLR